MMGYKEKAKGLYIDYFLRAFRWGRKYGYTFKLGHELKKLASRQRRRGIKVMLSRVLGEGGDDEK